MKYLISAVALLALAGSASAQGVAVDGGPLFHMQFGTPVVATYCLNGNRYAGAYPYGRWIGPGCVPGDVNYGYQGGVVVAPGRPYGGWHGHDRHDGPHH